MLQRLHPAERRHVHLAEGPALGDLRPRPGHRPLGGHRHRVGRRVRLRGHHPGRARARGPVPDRGRAPRARCARQRPAAVAVVAQCRGPGPTAAPGGRERAGAGARHRPEHGRDAPPHRARPARGGGRAGPRRAHGRRARGHGPAGPVVDRLPASRPQPGEQGGHLPVAPRARAAPSARARLRHGRGAAARAVGPAVGGAQGPGVVRGARAHRAPRGGFRAAEGLRALRDAARRRPHRRRLGAGRDDVGGGPGAAASAER